MFAKETYIERRITLKQRVESGLILLLGNRESPMNYTDNTYHFRQDSSFLYYFGLNTPNLNAIIDCNSGEEWIFGTDFTVEDFVWMGPQATISDQASQVGIEKTDSPNQLANLLSQAKSSGRAIHFLPPYRGDNKIQLFEWLGITPSEQQASASLKLIHSVIAQRNYKTAEEIIELTKAVNTSVEMHELAMRMAKPNVTEAMIAAAVQEVAESAGGHISFPVIATIHGEILHNHHHENTLKSGDLFLLDCGAETPMGYCGDLSSTIPVSGTFTSKQRDIYQLCLDSHNAAIDMLQPGVAFKEIHFQAARVIVDGFKDMGLMKGNTEDAITHGAHALFFPCGLGHMMGLDVHDMEDLGEVHVGYDNEVKSTQFGLKSLRLGRKLEPGFVHTIEPGIYFIPELIKQWEADNHNWDYINYTAVNTYKSFGGIRNEEDFLITESGAQLIGKPKPKSINDVENEWAKGV